MPVGRGGKFFNVQHRQGGVGDGLPEYRLGVGPEGGLQLLLRAVRGHKGKLDAHPLHGHRKQVVGPSVDAGGGYHMIPATGDVKDAVKGRGLAGSGEHGGGTPLHLADLGGHMVVGGILEPGIEIACALQVKQLSHVLAGGVFKGGALYDGDLARFSVPRGIASLHALGSHPVFHSLFLLPPGCNIIMELL